MPGHGLEDEPRGNGRRTCLESVFVQLADKRNMTHRMWPLLRPEIEVVEGQRLLKDRWVRTFGNRHQHGVDMSHVVPPDDVRTIGQTPGMLVICRPQKQCRRVDRSGR